MPAVRPRFAVPHYDSWQDAFKDAVRDPAELCRLLDLPTTFADAARAAGRTFPLFVPRGFVGRMRPGDPADPLLRQVLPVDDELESVDGFVADPVGDVAATQEPGLLQKYHGRALLITTGTCAVHCRYCFRRHFPYGKTPALARRLAAGPRANRSRLVASRDNPQRRRPADHSSTARSPHWSINWPTSITCADCESTRASRS